MPTAKKYQMSYNANPGEFGHPLEFFEKYGGNDRVERAATIRKLLAESKHEGFSAGTGFPGIDKLTGGLRGGELIIVGGKTKNGKTLFLQTLTDNLHKQGINVLWFTYEVPIRQFMEQMDENTNFYAPLELAGNDMDWIFERYLETKLKYNGCDVIFIDHLHYLVDMAQMRNPSLQIGSVVRKVKQFANISGSVVFLVSHVRNIEKGVEATEDDLRDSGMTKAEADSTWIVSRMIDRTTGEATNEAKLRICNHRRTGVMGATIPLIKTGKYFMQPGSGEPYLIGGE